MARTEALTREDVCTVIQSWGDRAISDADMRHWITSNYFPLHQQVAPGEPEHVALGIGIALTEFECASPPYPFDRKIAAVALALIHATGADFEERKAVFYRSF